MLLASHSVRSRTGTNVRAGSWSGLMTLLIILSSAVATMPRYNKFSDGKSADDRSDYGHSANQHSLQGLRATGHNAMGHAASGRSGMSSGASGRSATGRSATGRSASGRSATGRSATGRGASGRSATGHSVDYKSPRGMSGMGASAEEDRPVGGAIASQPTSTFGGTTEEAAPGVTCGRWFDETIGDYTTAECPPGLDCYSDPDRACAGGSCPGYCVHQPRVSTTPTTDVQPPLVLQPEETSGPASTSSTTITSITNSPVTTTTTSTEDLCASIDCIPLDDCHIAGSCIAGVCSNPTKADGSTCNDGNVDTFDDICVTGVCAGITTTATTLPTTYSLSTSQGYQTTTGADADIDFDLASCRVHIHPDSSICGAASGFDVAYLNASVGFTTQLCVDHETSVSGTASTLYMTVQPVCDVDPAAPQRWNICSWRPNPTSQVCSILGMDCCEYITGFLSPSMEFNSNLACQEYEVGGCNHFWGIGAGIAQRYLLELVACEGEAPPNPQCRAKLEAGIGTQFTRGLMLLGVGLIVLSVAAAIRRHRHHVADKTTDSELCLAPSVPVQQVQVTFPQQVSEKSQNSESTPLLRSLSILTESSISES